jgi:two-component system, NarL family, sensor kinase
MPKVYSLLILISVSIFCNTVKAYDLDSLLKRLPLAKEDTAKVFLLNRIGFTYGVAKPDSCVYYYTQAKGLSKKLGFIEGEIKYYINITGFYNEVGKYDTSLLLNYESVALAQKFNNKKLLANCLANLGNSYNNLHQLDSASLYFYKAESILEGIDDKLGLFILYGNICALYANLGENVKAINFALKAVALRKKGVGTTSDYIYILTNLGGTYCNLNKNDSVTYYATEAIKLAKLESNYPIILANLQNLIYAKINEGQYEKLPTLVTEMETLKPVMQNERFFAKINFNKALSLHYNGKSNEAKLFALKAFEISKVNNLSIIAETVSVLLIKIESKLGNYFEADKYSAIRDSIYASQLNEEIASGVKSTEEKYLSLKKDNEIFKLNTSNKQKSTLNKVFIGSTIGLGLLGFLGYRNFRAKRKLQQAKITELEKNKQLLTIDAMLQGQEEERSRIAKDLHDGLGGMLSGTKLSFMNMKENLIMDAPNISAFENSILQLDNTIAELRKVAHNLMPEALVKFGLKNAVLDYCNALQLSSKTKIVYEQMGEDRALGNTADLYIYRIIQELVNNSIKHANANTILVQLTKTPQKVLVTVEDDGKGFDKNLLSTSKGIGLQSVQQRIDYLKGSLQIDTKPNEGTSFHIELQA